jgi:2-methylcitrate dehydratase PrpD
VEEVEVRVDFDPPRSLVHHRPKTPLEAKFSMEYCVAAALLDGHVDLATFTGDKVMRPQARELMAKVGMARHTGFEGRPSLEEGYHQVRLRLEDGRLLDQVVRRSREGAIRGASMEEVRRKFRDCASQALPRPRVETAMELLDNLQDVEDVRELGDALMG